MEEKEHITIGQLSLRQISLVKSVLSRKGFSFKNVKEDSLKEGYTTYGTLKTSNAIIVVRLSNHICSMKNWSERYKAKLKANPKLLKRMGRNVQDPYKERHFFSIVFNAFDYNPNDSGKWKAICNEYVFNPKEVEDNGSIAQIARDSSNLSNGQTISINGITPTERVAIKEKQKVVNKESKQYNTNMNKNKIRLTESQLHNMISESVKRILSETRFGKPQPVFGDANNGKSAYLINDTGRMVAVIDNLKFVGNSIIGGNRATDEKVTFYLTGLFGHSVDGSTLPGTRKTKDGLYITHLQMDGGDEYYELLIDDYLLTPESAAEWDYYDPRNRRDIDDDINRFY